MGNIFNELIIGLCRKVGKVERAIGLMKLGSSLSYIRNDCAMKTLTLVGDNIEVFDTFIAMCDYLERGGGGSYVDGTSRSVFSYNDIVINSSSFLYYIKRLNPVLCVTVNMPGEAGGNLVGVTWRDVPEVLGLFLSLPTVTLDNFTDLLIEFNIVNREILLLFEDAEGLRINFFKKVYSSKSYSLSLLGYLYFLLAKASDYNAFKIFKEAVEMVSVKDFASDRRFVIRYRRLFKDVLRETSDSSRKLIRKVILILLKFSDEEVCDSLLRYAIDNCEMSEDLRSRVMEALS